MSPSLRRYIDNPTRIVRIVPFDRKSTLYFIYHAQAPTTCRALALCASLLMLIPGRPKVDTHSER
jgi:hypothetical protein